MQNIIHIIRNELSGMFTKNIVDEVVRRIEKAIERERGNRGDEEGVGTVSEYLC